MSVFVYDRKESLISVVLKTTLVINHQYNDTETFVKSLKLVHNSYCKGRDIFKTVQNKLKINES